jgi:hypothetical protein
MAIRAIVARIELIIQTSRQRLVAAGSGAVATLSVTESSAAGSEFIGDRICETFGTTALPEREMSRAIRV